MTKEISLAIPPEYVSFLEDLKVRIRSAQVRAAISVNRELVLLYWNIGNRILAAQAQQGWGAKVIQRLASDLKSEFTDMKGFSRSNLLYMRAFAEAWPEEEFVQQLAGQIPWFHHCLILGKMKTQEHRVWYIEQTIANGWSRNILTSASAGPPGNAPVEKDCVWISRSS